MSDDKLSFLEEEPVEDVEAEAEAPETPEEPEAEAPAEAPEQPEEPKQETGAKSPPPGEDGQRIPIIALLEEREKRQQYEAQVSQLQKRLQELEEAQEPVQAPDMFEDPEGYQQHQQQAVAQAIWNNTLNNSESMVREVMGDEAVDKATEAFKATNDPTLWAKLQQERHPYKWLVQWHQQQELLAEIGSDPAAYRARIEQEAIEKAKAELAQSPASKAPPRTLADAPSAGRDAVVSGAPGAAFDSMFPD